MFFSSRRRFLKQVSALGVTGTSSLVLGQYGSAQAQVSGTDGGAVQVYVDSRRKIASLDRNLFGSFLEHIGRAIYEGIYDPGSKLADENGFRKDVIEQIRQAGVPIIRYPGGNFVSGYNWLDGVGPRKSRPTVLDKAWNTLDSNQFGTNEFMTWCKAVGTLPLLGVNLGTGTPEQAAALVEYCNVDKGTEWSELRRSHGYAEPHKVKHWCLGNEMDGGWQIGHMPATEYGLKAQDAARQMRAVDPSVQLVVCGSSSPGMPTYLEWDREVLEQCYDYVDGLSLHRYLGNTPEDTGGDSAKFVALNLSMERQIEETLAVCDMVRGRHRAAKQLWLSFDEWNVWYRAGTGDASKGPFPQAPHIVEEVYNLEDALLVGGIVNTLLRHAGRVKIACLAQLVNVIAPIMTNQDGLFLQTTYYPYSWGLQYARGTVLDVLTESPGYNVSSIGQVPYVDVAATSADDGKPCLFVLNRDLVKARTVEVNWQDRAPGPVLAALTMTGSDLKSVNSFEAPRNVVPRELTRPATRNGRTTFEVPPRSYSVVQWGAQS
jgi:alpha-N-arabinofuranosidase